MRKSDDVHIKSIKVNGKRYWSNWRSTFISDNKRQAKEAAYEWAEMKRKQGKKAFEPYINTISGRARYKGTEIEDEYGNWNARYSTNRGEFVIHRGRRHHIYEVD